MQAELLGIQALGTEMWTGVELSFKRETAEALPWMFEALSAEKDQHAIIASCVMSDCIMRSKSIAKSIISGGANKELGGKVVPEHMLPTLIEVKLWKPGPVDGEIELCTVSGSPLVHLNAEWHDGVVFKKVSQPDMGVIGHLTKITLNDMGGSEEWKILSFMAAGSDKMDRTLPGGETIEVDVIVNEVMCPVDPHADQRNSQCEFYMATYCFEIVDTADGSLAVRDHTDAGASMQDMEDMGFASQKQFTSEAASFGYPLNLAASLVSRLQTMPYQCMLDAAGSGVDATCHDSFAGMSFIAGLHQDPIGPEGSIADFVVPMMSAHYTDAAVGLKEILHALAEELDPPQSLDIQSVMEGLERSCVAYNLFEWSLCALSNNLHLANQNKWKKLMRVMLSIEGTDA